MARQAHIVDFEEARAAVRRMPQSDDVLPRTSTRSRTSSVNVSSTAKRRPRSSNGAYSGSYPAPNREARSRAIRGGVAAQTRRGERPARVAEQSRKQSTVSDTIKRRQHDARKRKADRAFDRTVKTDEPTSNSGPRAAVYQTKMGSTHRRSSRMHTNQEKATRRMPAIPIPQVSGLSIPSFAKIPLIICACLLVGMIVVYQPAHDLYIATRNEAKAQIQLALLEEQNSALQSEVNNLSSDAGIQDRAATDFGWVQEGDRLVVVSSGLTPGDSSSNDAPAVAAPSTAKAPATWYSPILDPLFGYTG